MGKINLLRKVQIDGAWMTLPVAKMKTASGEQYDYTRVMYKKAPFLVKAGTFYLEYREPGDPKKKRRAVGDHPRDVRPAMATQRSVLDLRSQGVEAGDAPQFKVKAAPRPTGKTIQEVVGAFVDFPPVEYRETTYSKYKNALENFRDWCKKTHVIQVDRDDIKAFMSHLVNVQELDASTAVDKANIVAKRMRDEGATILMRKGDWPKVTERQPEIYKPEILKRLFDVAKPNEYALFHTFLQTGMRDQEVQFLSWDDFDARRGTLSVTKKPGFDPKNYQERTVPVPRMLVDLLLEHRRRQKVDEFYIFPTRRDFRGDVDGGRPDGKMLSKLKALAYRAKLNCGRCAGTRKGKPVSCADTSMCQEFGLHKFRHTYATTLLHDGVDLLSVQKLMGHKDLDSTRKYLRALEPEALAAKINLTSLATRFV